MPSMFLRALIGWLALMVAAVLNGTFRVKVLIPRLGERTGHVISTVALCILIFLLTGSLIQWIGPRSSSDALRVGGFWLLLTVVFEFGFGHFIAGKPWGELLADYNVTAGRIWFLVLLATSLAPLLTGHLRKAW